MRDLEGRCISYLRLSVTDRCDCRCRYCMPACGVPMLFHDDLLSFEELVDVVRAATTLGLRKVRVTGGEPLVRRGIVRLCEMLSEVEGVEELAMTTNATLLAPVAAELRAAGVRRLNVSLDTLRPERYEAITRTGRLADALRGIEAAVEASLTGLKLNCVLMRGVNDDEIPDFVAIARDHPIEVRFIELMPIGACSAWSSEHFLPADVVLERAPELRRVEDGGVAERYRAPGFAGTIGLIRPLSHRFCGSCDRIRVTADGRLKPCLHSSEEISLRGLHGTGLVEALARGIRHKPAHHEMMGGRASMSLRDMNEIGG